jgi:hypothetical protein
MINRVNIEITNVLESCSVFSIRVFSVLFYDAENKKSRGSYGLKFKGNIKNNLKDVGYENVH